METIAYTISGTTTETSLTALGVSDWRVTFGTHGGSTARLRLEGVPPDSTPVIPFETPCVIHTGRAYVAGAWSGGEILFQGRRTDNAGVASGGAVSTELTLEDAWYDLRLITLQAVWQTITGGTVASPTYGTATWPDGVLFQATPGVTYSPAPVNAHITTGQALVEILNYAISCGVSLQVGEIDPALYVPFYPVRSVRCAEAIKHCLRPHPDCTTEIDYTTTPPTFNVRQRSHLTAVTLPYEGMATPASGVVQTHLTSEVKPRPDLVPSRVGIYIKETATIAGEAVVSVGSDIYPAVSSGLRSLDASLDLTGPRITQVTARITSTVFDPTNLGWWELKVPAFSQPETVPGSLALLNTAINDGSKACITVVDETGAAVNLSTYAYVMEDHGTAHAWMQLSGGGPVLVTKAIVTGHFTYQRRKNLGTAASPVWVNIRTPNDHPHPVRVKLTNSPSAVYTLNQLVSTGEVYPTGLAAAVYNSLTTLQYEFNHTILEQPFNTIIKPGRHALNVSGGASAWSAMNAMVQEVVIAFINSPATGITSAKTQVRCGPVEHLEPGQLVQLFNLFQNRDLGRINPNERTSGLPNGGANAGMPDDTAKENTTHASPDDGEHIFSAPDAVDNTKTNLVRMDPVNGQLILNQLVNTTGTVNTAAPTITLAKADIIAGGTTNIAAKFQVFSLCLNDGTIRRAQFLATVPE